MKKDFKIKHTSVEIIDLEQHVYDLHNCYKIKGIKLISELALTRFEVLFNKAKGEWVKESDPEKIALVFQDVKHLEFSEFFFTEHSSTIDELGFKDSKDQDYDWLMGEEHFTGEQHFIFRFENGEHIRVFAEKIELTATNAPSVGLTFLE